MVPYKRSCPKRDSNPGPLVASYLNLDIALDHSSTTAGFWSHHYYILILKIRHTIIFIIINQCIQEVELDVKLNINNLTYKNFNIEVENIKFNKKARVATYINADMNSSRREDLESLDNGIVILDSFS